MFANAELPPFGNNERYISGIACFKWNPAEEEVCAAFDYALDSTIRNVGGARFLRRPEQGGNWSRERSHRWWLIDHRRDGKE